MAAHLGGFFIMSYESLLQHTATVYRKSTSVDAAGETSVTWAANETGVPCLVQQKNIAFLSEEKGELEQSVHMGFFKHGADIQAGDKIEVTDQEGTDIGTYVIGRPTPDVSGRCHHIEVNLRFVDEGVYG